MRVADSNATFSRHKLHRTSVVTIVSVSLAVVIDVVIAVIVVVVDRR